MNDQRKLVVMNFDNLLAVLRTYVDVVAAAPVAGRLVGVVPALEEARTQFVLATEPEAES